MGEHDELISDFVTEALEILDGYDEELVHLEQYPSNIDLINSIFRRVHNIKGMCGFLHFSKLEALSHAGEDLLAELRKGDLRIGPHHTDLLLNLGDSMRALLVAVQTSGKEGVEAYETLLNALRSALHVGARPADPSDNAHLSPISEAVFGPITAVDAQNIAPAAPVQAAATPTESSLRVDTALLDRLMNLAGELVLARNQILQLTKAHPDPTFRAIVHKLNSVTSELQESVMQTRVQPMSILWDKLPRVVRDVSHETGKKIAFSTSGGDTELDRAIIEAIKDPIIHLIRNAIDHGIEDANVREAAGKPPQGDLTLEAYPDGGSVIIELRDDGGGLNTDKIKQRAITQGLITTKQADSMSDSQIHRLIFTAGFSTADAVTHLSGRGVGMDVVRANIEAINGQVQVASERGRGTTMRLKIPMTLSIIPTLLVSSGGETFAVPEASVLELVKLSGTSGGHEIVSVGTSSFLRLREQLLPLVHLDQYLDLPQEQSLLDNRIALILCVDECRFGVVVDEVHDIEEIVVKSLDSRLQSLGLYAGATILGDGRIVLIIDPTEMLHSLELHRPDEADGFTSTQRNPGDRVTPISETFLIVATDTSDYTAIPLSHVIRLERVPVESLTITAGTTSLNYRGLVLPILDLATRGSDSNHGGNVPIVVLRSSSARELGLKVHSIIDISTTTLPERTMITSPTPLTLGIINEHTAVLLDVPSLCASTFGISDEYAEGSQPTGGQV
jgi:two-component system chemotaxis sensor kinase CheA